MVLIKHALYFHFSKRCIFSVTGLSLTTAFSWRAENALNNQRQKQWVEECK